MPSSEERTLAAVIYGISFFTAFIGPVIIWLMKKDESEFIDYHGKEYLNFLISYAVYTAISAILVILLVGIFLLWLLGIFAFIFTIIAAINAYDGKMYRIPFIFRIIR